MSPHIYIQYKQALMQNWLATVIAVRCNYIFAAGNDDLWHIESEKCDLQGHGVSNINARSISIQIE